MNALSGRNAGILVDSGADEHVSVTPVGPAKGDTFYDAQGHMIEAHGTRTVYMKLGSEGQSHERDNTDRQHGEVKAKGLKRNRLAAKCRKVIVA